MTVKTLWLGVVVLAVGAASCGTEEATQDELGTAEQEARARVCPMIYDPVCGKDGKTYSNECTAGGPRRVAYKGECVDPCAAVLCLVGTRCELRGSKPVCVPYPEEDFCATVRCADGYHCEAVQVQCITAPCDPIAQCVPTYCPDSSACGPALGMPTSLCPDGVNTSGPTGNCLEYSSGCAWEVASCP